MQDRIKDLKKLLLEREREIQYYKRMLEEISNQNLRELEDLSKVTLLLKEKDQVQEELHKAKRMESIGLMAGGVAHDLNNILSGIISYPEYLLLDLPDDSPLRIPLLRIQESGQQAAAVVGDLLTLARGVASTKKILDLNRIVDQYVDSPQHDNLISRYPHIKYHKNLDSSSLNIFCSEVHVVKCIMNLVANAAEAIGKEGEITLATYSKDLECETRNPSGWQCAILEVSDNGHGIPQESLDRIFEPFYTRKVLGRSGSGLGLSVVWSTMEDHNGFVEVTSNKQGSCFTLGFPHSQKTVQKESLTTPSQSELHGQGDILVVDDELIQREIAEKILTALGYKVIAVASGEEAVSYLRDNSVDLLLLDMILGPGMNGRETYQEIIAMFPKQKALIVSGFSESKDVKETCRLGAGGFVKKPYTIPEIGSAVKSILEP